MFRIAICSRQLWCQLLGHHCHTACLLNHWPSWPALTTRYVYDLVVPCTHCGLLLWNQQKWSLEKPEHIAPEKNGRLKRMVYYTDSRIFVNLSVLKSETLEIPTVVMISEKKIRIFQIGFDPISFKRNDTKIISNSWCDDLGSLLVWTLSIV